MRFNPFVMKILLLARRISSLNRKFSRHYTLAKALEKLMIASCKGFRAPSPH
jgi:hypothetical protein